jgi:ABC-type Na+ efflux pump permease subunit
MTAIYVLWLRELKRYVRSRVQIVISLAQPLLYLVALGFGFGPTFQKAGQGSYVQFVAPGVIGMTILFSATFSGIGLLWDRQFGFLKETLVAPVSRGHLMLGRTLGGATVATLQGLLIFVVTMLVGFRPGLGARLAAGLHVHRADRDCLCRAGHLHRLGAAGHAGLPGRDELPGDAALLSLGRAVPAGWPSHCDGRRDADGPAGLLASTGCAARS